jgi:hypothetical protein
MKAHGLFIRFIGFKARGCPTKRAPDGWWAPLFELGSSDEFGSV